MCARSGIWGSWGVCGGGFLHSIQKTILGDKNQSKGPIREDIQTNKCYFSVWPTKVWGAGPGP